MKILYLDCFSGISGDMLLGLLIDLGLKESDLTGELRKMNMGGYTVHFSKKRTGAICGSDVTVMLTHEAHGKGHHHGLHRNLSDCCKIIHESSLSEWVKTMSVRVFEEVAQAEAHVHGKSIDDVHFHEVGAVDSIVDIVGTFIGLEKLGIKKIHASPLHDGHGFITCAHGQMPVPVPAVAQMLASGSRAIPYIQDDVATELVTPTGMAIVKTIASKFGAVPMMNIQRIGYGTGKRSTGRINALRGILGEQGQPENSTQDEVVLLEANIDDQTGEILGYAMNHLLCQGALDAYYTPIYMKKNRPAVKLSVLAKPEDEEKITEIIFKETTTLGVRVFHCPRYKMHREFIQLATPYGQIHVKHAIRNNVEKWAPEFDDCAFLAEENQVPLTAVYDAARQSILQLQKNQTADTM
ncbi:nickel pincer cofactor biosynthesis protein LarC [Sporolactobacillus shoreicorticis]|uniref:Pyridinium-3,5-bisthiocarboxylic acid mononucleotide nickel insertion protein n=1 Tax=Sporolactobacillus shoreicorticis TaxID=1923877 RepID=A0ABW5S259_9BACL|nr:nickel pincer cofactor biosynthesis protein LarC [Sporolactobacillus shoreicorticis]MCO7125213.1 nickel pincer cofactor biosynthesis protein LarC [Sporolactobacillus shoreicorticis]